MQVTNDARPESPTEVPKMASPLKRSLTVGRPCEDGFHTPLSRSFTIDERAPPQIMGPPPKIGRFAIDERVKKRLCFDDDVQEVQFDKNEPTIHISSPKKDETETSAEAPKDEAAQSDVARETTTSERDQPPSAKEGETGAWPIEESKVAEETTQKQETCDTCRSVACLCLKA